MKASIGRRGLLLGASLAAVIGAPVAAIAQDRSAHAAGRAGLQRPGRDHRLRPAPRPEQAGRAGHRHRTGRPTRSSRPASSRSRTSWPTRAGLPVRRLSGQRAAALRSVASRRRIAGPPATPAPPCSWTKSITAARGDQFRQLRPPADRGPEGAAGHPLRPERGRRRGEHRHQPPRSRPFRRRRRRARSATSPAATCPAFVNVPLADGKAGLRLGGGLHTHDGYVDRDRRRREGGRGRRSRLPEWPRPAAASNRSPRSAST